MAQVRHVEVVAVLKDDIAVVYVRFQSLNIQNAATKRCGAKDKGSVMERGWVWVEREEICAQRAGRGNDS